MTKIALPFIISIESVMKLKRIWGFIAVLITLFTLTEVKAFSVDKDTFYIEPGKKEEVHLYANVEEEITSITFSLTFSSYDASATFTPLKGIKDNYNGTTGHEVVFSEAQKGKIDLGVVTIKTKTSAKERDHAETVLINKGIAKTEDGKQINLNRVNMLIYFGEEGETTTTTNTEPAINTPTNLLERIDSDIVTINLKENIFEYTVTVPSGTEELDLKPITTSESVRVTISSQVINELTDGAITITLEDGKTTQNYKINVKVKKAVKETEVDSTTEAKEYHYKWKYIVVIVLCGAIIAGAYFIKLPKGD